MNVGEFIKAYWSQGLLYLVLFTGLIQISPIKLNPWTWVAKKIGRAINAESTSKLDNMDKQLINLEQKLSDYVKKYEETVIENKRVRILNFSDGLQNGNKYSKSSFDQVLLDITDYNRYCNLNPDFKNKITTHAAKLIEDTYDKSLAEDSFL